MNLAAILIPPSLDAKQALRLRHFGLAALNYALATALVAVAWMFGMLPASAALEVAAVYVALNLGLYVVIRSGFNLRFEDPSLTRFQILAAITVLMYVVYHMDDGRNIALFGCFIMLLFGIFRLNAREFTVVTLYTLAAYAVVINLLMYLRPQAIHDVPGEWLSWLGLAAFLPSFTAIGGHINRLRRKLRESEARFRSLTEMSSDFYWESDAEHRLTARGSASRVSMFQRGAQIGERRWEISYLSPGEAGWQAHRAVFDAHRPFRDFEFSRLGADGTEQHISISGDPVFDASGALKGYRGVGKNISERKAAEAKIVRLTQFYAALSQCGHAIVRCASEEELLQQICRVAVVFGGVKMAWIGIIDPGTRMVRFAARYGDRADEYLQGVEISVDADSPLGRGPTGIAIRENRPFWCRDLRHQPLTAPWHERRARFGWGASASLPLRRGGAAVGVLSLYAGEAGAFDEAVSDLLIEMAADISFALDNFERESRRQGAEEALHESEARFRNLTEMSSDFYWESDAEHRLTDRASADKKLSTVSVFRQGAQIGERRWEIPYLSPDEAGWQAHRAVLDAHRPFRDFELSRLGADGTERHISISGEPKFDGRGRFLGYRGVGKDITEQMRRIDDLRRLRAAMDATIDSIYVTDLATMRFVEVNGAACRRLGYTREQLLELGPQDVLVVDREHLRRLYDEVIAAGEQGTSAETHYVTSDGRRGWTELHRRALSSGSGWLIVTLGRDITERKLAEEALQQKHAKLLQTEQELLSAHEALAEADRLESVGRLAAGVAHEVKNPLAIIRLGTDYLAKQFSQESNQEVLDDIRAAIDRAERVIRDLLDFSRQKPFAPRPSNINEVIDNAVNLTKHEIKRRNIVIIRNRDDLMPPIYADPDRLVQVFINLLSNAAQAIGQDGSIEIVTRSICLSERDLEQAETSLLRIGEPVITIDIRDSGPGISAEHEKKLFEPFFTTKPVGEGSGLGLAVSRSIVIMHRGSISISNRPEGGASALLMFRVDREHLTNEKTNTGSR
jgi:PAS domain S-box-containing protein